jgi:hypothetical protein
MQSEEMWRYMYSKMHGIPVTLHLRVEQEMLVVVGLDLSSI